MSRLTTALVLLIAFIVPARAEPDRAALRQNCHDDYKALCDGVQPGGGHIIACLQQHVDKLTPACKTALQSK